MKRILFLFLPFLPYLATAQVAKDTVTVLTLAQIPAGAIRDTTNFTFVQDNGFKKATFDSLYKYTRVKLLSLGAITSAELATALSNETGTGAAVFATSPALITPNLGTPSAATLTNATGLPIATGLTGLVGSNRIPYSTSAAAMTTSGDFIYNPSVAQLQIAGINSTAVSNTSFWNGNFIGLDITNNSTTTNTISGIRLRNGSNPVAGIAGIRESGTLTALGFFTGGSGVGGGTVPERMRITSGGNVGIGIAPTKKLEVYGDLANGDGIQLTDASNGYMRIAQSTGSAGVFAGMLSGQAVGNNPSFNLRGIQTATTPRTTATLQLQTADSSETGAIANTDKAITFLNWSTEIVTVLGNGNFGIGATNPAYKLDVNGNFRADSIFTDIAGNAVFSTSDARLKKNIEPVSSMLQKITALNPVTYEWNDLKIDQAINRENTAHLYGKKIGLIAQEVYEVFPDFVGTDADGNMVLSYGAFIVPMLKAIQEQQQQIEQLKQRITQLENK